jgi:hypothetical protein
MVLKGQVTIAIVLIIFTVTSIFSVVIPLLVLKYHLAIEVKNTYDYNNADLALLSLVSKNYNETYSLYRILSEHEINGFDVDMQNSLKGNLNLLLNSNCFKIVNTKITLLKPENCDPVENVGEIPILLPYNTEKLMDKIILVYK